MKAQRYFIKLFILTIFTLLLSLNTCKKEEEDYCSLITFSGGTPSISTKNCPGGTINMSTSNFTYDRYGRVVQYSFSITCGSKSYTGSFNGITYNNIGQALSCRAVINGTVCTANKP